MSDQPNAVARRGAADLQGTVRNAQFRSELRGERGSLQVLTFHLEQYDAVGKQLQPVLVELRGVSLEGQVHRRRAGDRRREVAQRSGRREAGGQPDHRCHCRRPETAALAAGPVRRALPDRPGLHRLCRGQHVQLTTTQDFFAAVFLAAVFLAAVFLAVAFLAVVFLAAVFFAVVFFAADLLAVFFTGPRARLSASSSAARSSEIVSTESSLRSVALVSHR